MQRHAGAFFAFETGRRDDIFRQVTRSQAGQSAVGLQRDRVESQFAPRPLVQLVAVLSERALRRNALTASANAAGRSRFDRCAASSSTYAAPAMCTAR